MNILERSIELLEGLNAGIPLEEMAFKSSKARKAFFAKKFKTVMHEWKAGKLHIGRSKTVVPKDRQKQALAIAFSVANKLTDRAKKHKRVYTGGL